LQGKYDAEVPRLHQQVRELQAAIQQMQHQINAPPPPPAAPEKPAEPERYVSDEDVANYGEDFVDIQRRIALDATRELRKQIDELKTQLVQQHTQVQTVSFETTLRQAIPDFAAVNADPDWVAWLNEVDPLLRGPRRMVAQAAYERQDVEAINGYVELFKQSRAAPPKPEVNREQELRRQVQPSRSAASAPINAQKTYTMAEADALFNRMQQLTAQGRIDEAKRLDAEISTAYAEGRVLV
jgi:ribosomal protein L29